MGTFLHVLFLGLWGGCVAVEMLMELMAAKNKELRFAVAQFHDRIDRYIELPILIGVLVTGAMLFNSSMLSSTVHVVKLTCGLIAVGANLLCIIPVTRRKIAADEKKDRKVNQYSKQVFLAFKVGFPAAVIALICGIFAI